MHKQEIDSTATIRNKTPNYFVKNRLIDLARPELIVPGVLFDPTLQNYSTKRVVWDP